jgi:hypothetical protein
MTIWSKLASLPKEQRSEVWYRDSCFHFCQNFLRAFPYIYLHIAASHCYELVTSVGIYLMVAGYQLYILPLKVSEYARDCCFCSNPLAILSTFLSFGVSFFPCLLLYCWIWDLCNPMMKRSLNSVQVYLGVSMETFSILLKISFAVGW